MNDPEILHEIQKLESMYGKLAGEQTEIYIEKLRPLPERDLREAVDVLLEVHPFKRFPFLVEIHRAVELARQRRPHQEPHDTEYCQRCQNSGQYFVEDGAAGTARYCNCRFGHRQYQAHQQYLNDLMAGGRKPTRRDMDYPYLER